MNRYIKINYRDRGKIMSKWISNLIAYEKNKAALKCPYCSNNNVEVLKHSGKRRSITFTCKDCGKSEHFDGTLN